MHERNWYSYLVYATVHSSSSDRHVRAFGCKGSTPFDVVVIAGSAGGIHALTALLAALPEDFPAGIVVVQHLPPAARYRSALDRVVQRATKLRVKWAEEGERIHPGAVFLAPQDRHLHVDRDHVLHLANGPKINGFRPAADPLFTSVAAYFGARSIAVVLSGILSDGAQGAGNIARQGGRVLVQDNVSA